MFQGVRGAYWQILPLLVLWAGAGLADYRAGVEAYRVGDFATAHREWLAVAGQEDGAVEPAVRAESCYALAMLYWLGQGIEQDSAESAKWLQEAADLNHAGAQSKLGYLYLIGQGVPQSDFEAFKWLRMAAHGNDADAQYNLGVMYRDGRGVAPSPERAVQWFSEAAANGDRVSAAILEEYQRTATFKKTLLEKRDSQALPEDWPPGVGREPWIASRDPGRFTIQMIAVRRTEAVKAFITRHPELAPFAVFRQGVSEAPLWVVLQGDYATERQAREVRSRFPAGIQPHEKLRIRPFGQVQSELGPGQQ